MLYHYHMPRFIALGIVAALLGLPVWLIDRAGPEHGASEGIVGEVRDENGPVSKANVRIKGQSEEVLSDDQGRFRLARKPEGARVTAWKDGYFIGGAPTNAKPLVIQLQRLPEADCERYAWVDPTPDPTQRMNCGNCHKTIHDEWRNSGHANSA